MIGGIVGLTVTIVIELETAGVELGLIDVGHLLFVVVVELWLLMW